MILHAKQPEKPRGVLVDKGTGRRIPFARSCNMETGEYEAFQPTADGTDIIVDAQDRKPIVVKGKAVGKLELVPLERAHQFGRKKPELVKSDIQPMTADEKREGLEQYKGVFIKVWAEARGEARKTVDHRWGEFIQKNSFLDAFVIRRSHPVS